MGRRNAAMVLSEQGAGSKLEALTRSRSMPHALVRRAKIVLLSAARLANAVIAERCAVSPPTVSLCAPTLSHPGAGKVCMMSCGPVVPALPWR